MNAPDPEHGTIRHGPLTQPARPRRLGHHPPAPREPGGGAWDTPLDPMATSMRALVRHAAPERVKSASALRPATDWRVHFAPPAHDAAPAADDLQITYLGIHGVAAPALRRVLLQAPGAAGLEIDSLSDARGQLIAAGDLVESMAWACGLPGMVIDTRGRGLRWAASTVVTLHIHGDGPDGAAQASVTVRVE